MTIKNLYWQSLDRDAVSMLVVDGEKELHYTATPADPEPINQELWALAMENKDKIAEPELYQAIRGQIPWPHDLMMMPDSEVVTVESVRREALALAERELRELFNPRILIKAERNPEYAEERAAKIDAILRVEEKFNASFAPQAKRARGKTAKEKPILQKFTEVGLHTLIMEEVFASL